MASFETEVVPAMKGGKGHVILQHILGERERGTGCRLYARVTLKPGCSLGYHEHHGESESYYILSGTGVYDDNGTKRSVAAGDASFTPSGKGHALACSGYADLVFIALILAE
ncbi:MAG: cupin domain-containing protein [Ruthenibacterium sp.]